MSKVFMGESQISSLLKNASTKSARDSALFHVALATGFRAGDLLRLKVADVCPGASGDPVARVVRIKMQKTGKQIERVLPDPCRKAILIYLDNRRESRNPFLFPSESNNTKGKDGPMTRFGLHKLVKRYLGVLYPIDRLRGNSCHVTRRSMAKLISDKAGRIEPATRFLGHTSVANTVAYLDMDQFGRQADDIVGAMLDKDFASC